MIKHYGIFSKSLNAYLAKGKWTPIKNEARLFSSIDDANAVVKQFNPNPLDPSDSIAAYIFEVTLE